MAEGIEKGRAEGLEQGRVEGRAEGLAEGIAAVAKNMKAMGLADEDIARATGLSAEEVNSL